MRDGFAKAPRPSKGVVFQQVTQGHEDRIDSPYQLD